MRQDVFGAESVADFRDLAAEIRGPAPLDGAERTPRNANRMKRRRATPAQTDMAGCAAWPRESSLKKLLPMNPRILPGGISRRALMADADGR